MYAFIVWGLVFCLVPAASSYPSSSCYFSMMIGNCKTVSGPAVSCSQQLYDQVNRFKQLSEQFLEVIHFKDSGYRRLQLLGSTLYHSIIALDNLTHFVRESLAQQESVFGETCVAMNIVKGNKETLGKQMLPVSQYFYWMDCLFPIFGSLVFILGMAGNCLIVVMFFLHEDLRTESNIMVVNLAISDILLLVDIIPRTYSTLKWMDMETRDKREWLTDYLRCVFIAVIVYSMVVLSMLRYLTTESTPGSRTKEFLQSRKRMAVLPALVWLLAAVIGVVAPIDRVFAPNIKLQLTLRYLRLVFLYLLPLILVIIFSLATWVLRRSIPDEQTISILQETRVRKRGPITILSLVIILCLTHVPLNIALLQGTQNFDFVFISLLLIGLSCNVNPIGLIIGSKNFRNHLKTYIVKCKSNNSKNSPETAKHTLE